MIGSRARVGQICARTLSARAALAFALLISARPARADALTDGGPRVLHYHFDDPSAETTRDRVTTDLSTSAAGASRAADDGQLLPQTIAAETVQGQAYAKFTSGYDSAGQTLRLRGATEARVTGALVLRADFEHGPGTGSADRVGLGARYQLLRQSVHEIDLGIGALYQPKDFRGEGNIVGAILVSRRLDRLLLAANVLGGVDSEGDDGSAEGSMAMLYRVNGAIHVGWDGRFRYNFSDDAKRFNIQRIDWEAQLESTAMFSLGPMALLSEAGLSSLQLTAPGPASTPTIRTGVIAMLGGAAAF